MNEDLNIFSFKEERKIFAFLIDFNICVLQIQIFEEEFVRILDLKMNCQAYFNRGFKS